MKCPSLLKPSKITYTHQANNAKQNVEYKGKASSRNSSNAINERSSMPDLMAMVSSQSRKNVILSHQNSNKQNLPKNGQSKDAKKDSLSKSNNGQKQQHSSKGEQNLHYKGLQMYLSQKMPKPSNPKPNRNMSMHISRDNALQQLSAPNSRLNNSSITQKQLIPNNKKKRLSKPLVQHSSLLNINHHFNHHNSSNMILSRSPFSDKSVLMKEKKEENAKKVTQKNYDSCKSVEDRKKIEQSKSMVMIRKQKIVQDQSTHSNLNSNKQSIGLVKNSNPSTINKPQSKSKSILVLKENKGHQSTRKIKRTKMGWLLVLNFIFAETSKKGIKNCSLYDVVQGFKLYEKKCHPLEEIMAKDLHGSQQDQKITLTQLLLFVKLTLLQFPSGSSNIVFKPQSKELDPQKTYLTFNQFGKIIFSQQSILQCLQTQQIVTSNSQQNSSYPSENRPQLQKQSPSQTKNPHNMSTKEDEEIVQTARFQENHPGYHHSRQSSDGMDKKGKKKNIIFMNPNNHEEPYSQGIELISAKLHKSYQQNDRKLSKQQAIHPSPVDKSFVSRKSSSSTSKQPKSNGTTNKEISHCSIEDISQILQINQHQKPLVTSFNKKFYPSIQNNTNSFPDPFADDSLMNNNQQSYKNSNGMQEISLSKGMESGQLESCRIQALNMNSSLLFLESVILNNLYHTNFNISFSDQPIDNEESLMKSLNEIENREKFNKLEDVIQEVQNILKSMKNIFSLECEFTSQHHQNRLFSRNLKQSIKIQDLTEMQEFLQQFIDYKVFRTQNKSSSVSKSEYFNAVKLTENNLTSFQTRKAVQNVIKSSLVSKYFSYMEGVRINNAPVLIQNIDRLLLGSNRENGARIKILNLANNQLVSVEGVMNVVERNIKWLEFLNLSGNRIESIEGLFEILRKGDHQEKRSYLELKELHLKNNRISVLNYKLSPKSYATNFHFPSLQLIDLRSNMIAANQKASIQYLITQSPHLSIMSLKLNPIITQKTPQRTSLQKLLNKKSIYEYDSLQMMSAYIKYKDITFSDSGDNCCSLIQQEEKEEEKRNQKVDKNHKRDSKIVGQPLNKRKVRAIKNVQLQDSSY